MDEKKVIRYFNTVFNDWNSRDPKVKKKIIALKLGSHASTRLFL